MGVERSTKYAKKEPSKSQVVSEGLDNTTLELMCRAVVSGQQVIRRGQLFNIKSLLETIDESNYQTNPDKLEKIDFIKKGLEARLHYNINDPEMVLIHISGTIFSDNRLTAKDVKPLTAQEANWLSGMISDGLKYSRMQEHVMHLQDVCTQVRTAEFGTKQQAVKALEQAVNNLQNEFRRCRNESIVDTEFSLEDGVFEEAIRETYADLSNPGKKLVTGMQGMNELLGGGFESGRCYVYFGLPGEGKSALLLNMMYQMKKYNRNYVCKDPSKRPCIVLLTMENMTKESIARMFSIVTGHDNMTDYGVDEVIRMMREDGELFLNDDTPINTFIKFVPSNSVDTSYLYTLTDDLEDRGFEVIAFIQDYIGRIRSTERYADTRLEYGAVIDEFKIFAELKDIPIITASQLNRDASKHIDEGRKSSKSDLVRTLGRSNISESLLILNNTDGGFIIAPEYSSTGEKFMGVQRIKKRYNSSDTEYVYLPFEFTNIRLKEDFGRIANFRTTMREITEMNYTPRTSPYQMNPIQEFDSTPVDGDVRNIFSTQVNSQIDCLEAAKRIRPLYSPIVFTRKLYSPIQFYR